MTDEIQGDQMTMTGEPLEPVEKPVEPTEAPKPEDKTLLRDTIREAVRKSSEEEPKKEAKEEEPKEVKESGERERGPDGKFVAKKEAPEKVETPPDEKPLEGAKPEPSKDAAPGTWRAEAKAKWEGLDPVVKAEVLKRESDLDSQIGKTQRDIQQINQIYGPIEQVIGPRRALWRAQWGSEGQALNQILNLSDLASQDPNAFLKYYISQPEIAQKVNLEQVFGQDDTGDDLSRNPVVQQLQQTINGLTQQVSGFVNQRQEQEVTTVASQIDAFVSEKDESGNLKRPHFESVRDTVHSMIPALREAYPQASVQEVMQKAYDAAVYSNPNLTSEIQKQTEQRVREAYEKELRAKKAQLANKSVPSGMPPSGDEPTKPASDLRAELVRNMRAFSQGDSPRV